MKRGAVRFGLGASVTLLFAACSSSRDGSAVSVSDGGGADSAAVIDDDASKGDAGRIIPSGDATTSLSSCDAAADAHSYVGCDYWPTVTANNVWSVFDFAVVVANGQSVKADVTINGPDGFSRTVHVPAGGLSKIYLPWVADLKGADFDVCTDTAALTASVIVKGGAYHLVSSVPVSLFQFSALEYQGAGGPTGKDWSSCPGNLVCHKASSSLNGQSAGCYSFSNDASLLLPSTAWTGNYRVTGNKGLGVEVNPVDAVNGTVSIIAATDGTNVTVKLPAGEMAMPGQGITGTSTLSFTLDAGDVAQLASQIGREHDLSGALVTADQPVQVIASTPCSTGGPTTSASTCDHIEESVFPAETLGKHYVVAPPTSPGGRVVGHEVRFYGNVDGTTLTYAPSAPDGCPTTINAGEVAACTGIVTSAFEVTADHELAIGSIMLSSNYQDPGAMPGKGDPSLTLAVGVEQYRADYIFLAPDDYDENWIDIIAPSDATITLDGAPLAANADKVTSNFVVIRAPLDAGQGGAHVLTADKPVGLQVLGFGSFTSYAYPGGLGLKLIAPPPPK